jgi:hypothetical protein
MQHHSVSSRAIRSIGYDEVSMTMEVVFRSGSTRYRFCGVPKSVFNAFLSAGSKGSYFHRHIKDHYHC